jgi:hypothetical protein
MKYPNVNKRDDLPKFFMDRGFRVGAEIGVMKGEYSLKLCKAIPNLRLYCVDIWDMYPGYDVKASKNHQQEFYEIARSNLWGFFGVEFLKMMSMDAVKCINDKSLDFVYIDGNHDFDYVMEDIIEWSKKVKSGGIVSGHDYFHFPAGDGGVVQAVDCYVSVHKIPQVYLTLDRETSWFWFKP